jgi:hypothetical protein
MHVNIVYDLVMDAVCSSECKASNGRVIRQEVIERMRNVASMASLQLILRYLHEGTGMNHGNPRWCLVI